MGAWAYAHVEPRVQSLDVAVVNVDAPSLNGSEELGGTSVLDSLQLTPYCVEPDAPDVFGERKRASKLLGASETDAKSRGLGGLCCLKSCPSQIEVSSGAESDVVESNSAASGSKRTLASTKGEAVVRALNLAVGVVVRGRDFQASPRSGSPPSQNDAHVLFSILRTDGTPGAVAAPLNELVRKCRVSWHPLEERLRPKGQDLAKALSEIADFWKEREPRPIGVALSPKSGTGSPTPSEPQFGSSASSRLSSMRVGTGSGGSAIGLPAEAWRPFLGPAGGAKVVFTADLAKLSTRFARNERLPGLAIVSDVDQVLRTSSALKPFLLPSAFPEPEAPGVLRSDVSSLTPAEFAKALVRKRPLSPSAESKSLKRAGSCPSLDSLKRLCASSQLHRWVVEQRESKEDEAKDPPEEEEEVEFPLSEDKREAKREPFSNEIPQFLEGSHLE